jgi:hypothetical protein
MNLLNHDNKNYCSNESKYGCIIDLIKKYDYINNEPKKIVRSNKLNYDALEKMLGREYMIKSGLLD